MPLEIDERLVVVPAGTLQVVDIERRCPFAGIVNQGCGRCGQRRGERKVIVEAVALGAGALVPHARAQFAKREFLAGARNVPPDAVFVVLRVAGHILVAGGSGLRPKPGRSDVVRLESRQRVVLVEVRVGRVVEIEAAFEVCLEAKVLEVGFLVGDVVAVVGRLGRIVAERKVLAELCDLIEGRAVAVGLEVLIFVVRAEERQCDRVRERRANLEHLVRRVRRGIGQVPVGRVLLRIHENFRAAQRVDRAGVDGRHEILRVEAAVGCGLAKTDLIADFRREHVDRTAEVRLPELTGIAGTAIDRERADGRCREVRRGMVRRIVGIAERDTVVGHIVFAVLEAAQDGLGFGEAGAVLVRAGHAGRDLRKRREVGGLRDGLFHVLLGDDRHRLRRQQGRFDRG